MNLIKKNIFIATTMALFFCCNMAMAMKQEEKQLNEVVQPEKIFEGHEGEITDLLFFGNNTLVSSSVDKTVRIWDATTGKCLQVIKDCIHSDRTKNKLARINHNIVALLSGHIQ